MSLGSVNDTMTATDVGVVDRTRVRHIRRTYIFVCVTGVVRVLTCAVCE